MQLSIPFTAYVAALGPLHADLLTQGYVPERPSVAVLNDADDKRKGPVRWQVSYTGRFLHALRPVVVIAGCGPWSATPLASLAASTPEIQSESQS